MHPLAEARLHYVEPGLDAIWARPEGPPARLRVLDVGFGRGMNSAALLEAVSDRNAAIELEILGFEPHPEALDPWPHRPPRGALFPWWGSSIGRWRQGLHTIEVRSTTAQRGLAPDDGEFDLVLLDLFSPNAHPEHWGDALMARLAAAGRAGCVLTTYSCARAVRDRLAQAGWEPEVIRRPGVRDTLRALLRGGEQR